MATPGASLSAVDVQQLVAEQLKLFDDRQHRRISQYLVHPYVVLRGWDYAKDVLFPCWTVYEDEPHSLAIVYCDQGFGPRCPWGLVSLSGESRDNPSPRVAPSSGTMGPDSSWFRTLREVFAEAHPPEG